MRILHSPNRLVDGRRTTFDTCVHTKREVIPRTKMDPEQGLGILAQMVRSVVAQQQQRTMSYLGMRVGRWLSSRGVS
jgi:hypothetical protein